MLRVTHQLRECVTVAHTTRIMTSAPLLPAVAAQVGLATVLVCTGHHVLGPVCRRTRLVSRTGRSSSCGSQRDPLNCQQHPRVYLPSVPPAAVMV